MLWVLWSVLLAMSLGSCASIGKRSVEDLALKRSAVVDEGEEASADDAWDTIWELIRLEEKTERILAGEGLEGHADHRQWTDERGVRRIEVDGPPHNPYSYAFEIHPDGSKTISYGNGNPMKMVEEKPGSRVYLMDTKGDGVFDKRVTIRFFSKTKTEYEQVEYVFEKRTPDGIWELEEKTRYWRSYTKCVGC
jgi:hypothetical protein